jgi:uncharacterized membrane protein YheB (UPF0754 family)
MNNILLLAIPPLVGAGIGFITNVLAIRMLFRPLRAYHLFGIRIPFTPGILPRERAKLAESIGAMVERELLTPESLRERLAGPELQEKFRQGLLGYAEQIPGLFTAGAEKIYPRAVDGIIGFLQEPEMHGRLVEQGCGFIDDVVSGLPPIQRMLVTSGQFDRSIKEQMPEIIDGLIERIYNTVSENDVRDQIINTLKGRLLTPENNEAIGTLITEKLFAAADIQVEKILAAVDVKALVRDRINRMDMLRVEGIILDVMANQLKWIDVFGAILGFLIGLFQVLFSWSVR